MHDRQEMNYLIESYIIAGFVRLDAINSLNSCYKNGPKRAVFVSNYLITHTNFNKTVPE